MRSPGAVEMKFRIVVVGRTRHKALAEVTAEYEERAARYWPLEVIELRDESGRDAAEVKRREGERMLQQLGGGSIVVCDERGASHDSERFAAWMQRQREAARDVTFVIGGAFGLHESVLAASTEKLALAPWTLPHEVARLVLTEQLYRAGTIVRREPYHK